MTDVQVVRIDADAFQRLSEAEPALAQSMLLDLARILALRLRMASGRREPARVKLRIVVLAALVALLVAAPASARSVPRGWLGAQADGPLADSATR